MRRLIQPDDTVLDCVAHHLGNRMRAKLLADILAMHLGGLGLISSLCAISLAGMPWPIRRNTSRSRRVSPAFSRAGVRPDERLTRLSKIGAILRA